MRIAEKSHDVPERANRKRSGKTRHGSKGSDAALTEAALAATRSNAVYLAAQHQWGHGAAMAVLLCRRLRRNAR